MNKLKFLYLILFYLPNFSSFSQVTDFKNIHFENADKIAFELKGKNLNNLPELSSNLTKDLVSDVEKFRAIYTWVCTNVENDYYLYKRNSKKREKFKNDSLKLFDFNKKINTETFKKLIKNKKTVCSGYAYLIKELSNLANIKCEIVNGYGRTAETDFIKNNFPNHSWNAVELNSKWYLCDPTWSSGLFDMNTYKFDFRYNDCYFLQDPSVFLYNHFPIEKKWLLVDKSTNANLNEFINYPLLYIGSFKNGLIPISPNTFKLELYQGQEILFKIKELKSIDIDLIRIELVSGNNKLSIIPKIIRLPNNILELKYDFAEKGNFDLHIKINEDYLFTYLINVRKKK